MNVIAPPRRPAIHNNAKRRRWLKKLAKIQSGLRKKATPRYTLNRANRRAAQRAARRKERRQACEDNRRRPLFAEMFAPHCQRCNLRFEAWASARCQCKALLRGNIDDR